jgi:hypothetical protein
MKNLINCKRAIRFFLIVTGFIIIQSCAVNNRYSARQMVTVPDIVQMSKDGVASKDIIGEIRKSHTVYGLKANQLAKLRDEGVQDSVINYMEKTHIDAIRQNQRMEDSYYLWPGYNGYWYGGFGFGWPYYGGYWGWGPGIIFSNRGEGYRGGFYSGGFHGGGSFHGGSRR